MLSPRIAILAGDGLRSYQLLEDGFSKASEVTEVSDLEQVVVSTAGGHLSFIDKYGSKGSAAINSTSGLFSQYEWRGDGSSEVTLTACRTFVHLGIGQFVVRSHDLSGVFGSLRWDSSKGSHFQDIRAIGQRRMISLDLEHRRIGVVHFVLKKPGKPLVPSMAIYDV